MIDSNWKKNIYINRLCCVAIFRVQSIEWHFFNSCVRGIVNILTVYWNHTENILSHTGSCTRVACQTEPESKRIWEIYSMYYTNGRFFSPWDRSLLYVKILDPFGKRIPGAKSFSPSMVQRLSSKTMIYLFVCQAIGLFDNI